MDIEQHQSYETIPSTSESPKKSNKTIWMIVGLTVGLIIIFGIFTVLFFLIWNQPNMHHFSIINNTSESINVLFGSEINGFTGFEPILLSQGQSVHLEATPAAQVTIQAYYAGSPTPSTYPYPFTKLVMYLAGENYTGKVQIKNGDHYITVPNNEMNSSQDLYGVSIQDGYNLKLTVSSTNGTGGCGGPAWGTPGSCTGTLIFPHPEGDEFACMTPCFASSYSGLTGNNTDAYCCIPESICDSTGGCKQFLEPYYSSIFYPLCPECLITNCDTLNFQCNSSINEPSNYSIAFYDL